VEEWEAEERNMTTIKTLEEQIAEALAERDALVVHEVEADSEVPS
jgi:hypothetical protein